MRFEWDKTKAALNLAKHGVSFEEAATVLDDPRALPVSDDARGESRLAVTGLSASSRLLFVVVVERTEDVIRIVSARRATKAERRRYDRQ